MNIRVLTMTQPWATLVIIGAKKIETRHDQFQRGYRGRLVIHAAKDYPRECRRLCVKRPFRDALEAAGIDPIGELPVGAILGLAEVVDDFKFVEETMRTVGYPESAFGDFTAGRVGLRIANPRRLPKPMPYSGALGLWKVPEDVVARINAALAAIGVAS